MFKKKKSIIIIIISILLVIGIAIGLYFILNDKDKLTVSERNWVNESIGTIQNINVVNNVNVFGKVDVDGVTRYYGKGSGSRYLHVTSGGSTCEELNSDMKNGREVVVSFVETGLTSNEAIALERKLIERDFESLYNKSIAKTLRSNLEKAKSSQAKRSYVEDMIKFALSSDDTMKIGDVTLKNITQFWKICEMQSAYEGKKADKSLHHFLKNVSTREFIEEITKKYKTECVHIIGSAAKAQTYAPIDLLFFAGKKISTEFHFEVIDAFINNKILEWRDVSGDEFKALNIAIDNYLPNREEKRLCHMK
jgi:hypothetical protein